MGKKSKKQSASSATSADTGTSKAAKKEVMELVNKILEKCTVAPGSGSKEWDDYVEIYNLVEKLQEKQKGIEAKPFVREEHVTEFNDWLKKNGVNIENVAIADFDGSGLGLKANTDIKAGDLFLTIPRKLMMSIDSARQSVLGPLMSCDRMLQAMPNVVLALHLLCERSCDSFWLPYIKILPSHFSTVLYFTPDELEHLKGTSVLSDAINLYRNITRQYTYFYKLFQSHHEAAKLPIRQCFAYSDYRWAVSTVMTRQNQIPTRGGEQLINAFIPLWDMCNHSNGQMTTDFDLDQDCSACYALQDFSIGQQVNIFYGARTNAEFFLHSGFVYPENEHDTLKLKLGISKNDNLHSKKAELLAMVGLPPSGSFLLRVGVNPVDQDLLAFLRVFQMTEDDLKKILAETETKELSSRLTDLDTIINKDNEVKAWSFLEIRATLLLKAYPTTQEEDVKLLDNSDISDHKKLCVRLRLCEKRILRTTQDYAAKRKQAIVAIHDPEKNDV